MIPVKRTIATILLALMILGLQWFQVSADGIAVAWFLAMVALIAAFWK